MKKNLPTLILLGILGTSTCTFAATVNVFMDLGTRVPGSTNTGTSPLVGNDISQGVKSWDVLATTETGLNGIGAAVMEVTVSSFMFSGNARNSNHGGGNGLAIGSGGDDTSNAFNGDTWKEAALFQFSFYSDLAKTSQISGLTLTLDSITSRMEPTTNKAINAYVSDKVLTDNGLTTNSKEFYLDGTVLSYDNDATNATDQLLGIAPASTIGGFNQYTMPTSGLSFGEDELIWFRRNNTGFVNNVTYQMGALSFTVIPEPGTYGLFAGFLAFACVAMKRRV